MTDPNPCEEAIAIECDVMASALYVHAEEVQSQGSKGALLRADGIREAADYIRDQHPIAGS